MALRRRPGAGRAGLAARPLPCHARALLCCALALLCAACAPPAAAAPAGTQDESETKPDVPLEQLEKLKADPAPQPVSLAPDQSGQPVTPPPEETTTKVFHGAARLVQAGAGAGAPLPQPAHAAPPAPPAHSAVRRSFNADINRELHHNRDHFSAYGGVLYSPLDMAEYVLWTGDERAVTAAVESLLQDGQMTKEEAIMFLQEIKVYLEYLRAQHAPDLPAAEAAEWAALALGESPARARAAAPLPRQPNNALTPFPAPLPPPLRPRRRADEALLQTNLLDSGVEFGREAGAGNGGLPRGEDVQRALEEVVYHLAKMVFAQAAAREEVAGAGGAMASVLRVLQRQAQRAQLARGLQHQLLDIIIAALTDSIGDHPELLQTRESYDIPADRLMHDFLEPSVGSAPAPARLGRPFGY